MRYLEKQGHERSARYRGAGFVVLLTAVALSLASAMPAGADDGPAASEPMATASPTETPAPTPAPAPALAAGPTASPSPAPPDDVAPRDPLAIVSPANDTLFPSSTVTMSGTKDAAGRVKVQSLTGGAPYCDVSDGRTWNCTFDAPTGQNTVTVFQSFDGDPRAPEQQRVTIRVLPAPTIDGTSPIVTTGLISGTGHPGSGIILTGANVGDCPGIVQPNGFWSCPLAVSASGDYIITAQQTWNDVDTLPGGPTRRTTIRVDKDPPAVPVFSEPTSGAQPGRQPIPFAGSAETGGRVEVFVDGTLVCTSSVAAERWACTAPVGGGQHTVQAIQWDAAGNPSGATIGIAIVVSGASAPAIPPPAPTTPSVPSVRPTQTADPAPVPAPAPAPTQDTAQPPAVAPAFPLFPPPVGGISGLPPLDTWGTPTDYGAAIPTVGSTGSGVAWLWGLALGAGFILLVAMPLRLVLTALRGRFPRHYFARDHSRLTASEVQLLRPRLTLAGAIGAAAALAALAGGIQGEVRYLRLALAIGVALLLLNGITVVLTTKLATRALGGATRLRLVPLFLAIAAISALVSRSGGIQPPVIIGVVIAASFVVKIDHRSRGKIAATQLVMTLVLGVSAWLAHSALGPVLGFLPSLASEVIASLCIAAIGSAVMLALPVSRMPGRLIFEWSPVAWVAVALVTATLAGVIIAGGATFPISWMIGLSLAFAAVCLALWAWIRLIEPSFEPRRVVVAGRRP